MRSNDMIDEECEMDVDMQEHVKMLSVLKKLVRLCPSSEGLGGHAPLGAFYQVAWEAQQLISTRLKRLTPEQQLLESYFDQAEAKGKR